MNQLEEISKALHAEVNRMLDHWDVHQLTYNSKKKRSISLSFIADGLNWCCGVATQQKFDSMVMDVDTVRQQVSSIHDGLDSVVHIVGEELDDIKVLQETAGANLKIIEHKIKSLENYNESINNNIHDLWKVIGKGYLDTTKKTY